MVEIKALHGSDYIISKRIASGIMSVIVLVVILLSAFYIAAESDHDCEGEDCPVCAFVQMCENNLHRLFTDAAPHTTAQTMVTYIFITILICMCDFACRTLISKKVRLND